MAQMSFFLLSGAVAKLTENHAAEQADILTKGMAQLAAVRIVTITPIQRITPIQSLEVRLA